MRRPKILERSGFVRLLAGQGVSALADWMATIAFMAITHGLTQSSTAVGGILVLRLAPGVVAAPLAGRLAHRFGYRRTLLAMDLARAGMALMVPLMLAVWWIYLWAFLIEVASLLFLPARDSAIPELVERDEIPTANILILALSYGTIPLGAGAFAAVAAVAGGGPEVSPVVARAVFWADAATFLVSFEFIRRITELGDEALAGPSTDEEERRGGFLEAFRIPLARVVLTPVVTITLALGALFSLGIALVTDVLRASDMEFGVLIALFGVGGAIGMALFRGRKAERRLTDLRVGVAGLGIAIFVTVSAPLLIVAYVGAVGFGAAVAYALATGMSTVQERLHGDDRVLAFTSFHILIRAGLGLGAIGAGVAGDLLGRVGLPALGEVGATRVVLFCSGLIVLGSAFLVREPAEAA